MKHLQKFRFFSRFFFLALLFIIPLLSWYLSHIPAGDVNTILNERPATVQYHSLKYTDKIMHNGALSSEEAKDSSKENQEISDNLALVNGDIWSGRVGSIEWLDLLAWAELTSLSKAIMLPLMAGGLTAIILTAFCGRVFCSWMCPAGFIFDLGDKLRTVLEKRGAKFRNIKFKRLHKYVLLVSGLLIGLVLGLPILGYFYPPALMAREAHSIVYHFFDNSYNTAWFGFTLTLSGISLFLFGILMFETFISRRAWCRYICPGGALYSLFGHFRLFRIKRIKSSCTDCGDCNKVCPMGLHPMADKMGVECDNCFECHSSCPEGALPISFCQHAATTRTRVVKKVNDETKTASEA